MVAGLQYDASQAKLKLLELQRAVRATSDMILFSVLMGSLLFQNTDLEKFVQGHVDNDAYPISWQSYGS